MPKPRLAMACALVLVAAAANSSSSLAAGLPPDPTSNFAPDPSCSDPSSCLTEAVGALDQARARLGLPPYQLPSNFSALGPAEQVFVLTNLDRVYYGLAPITGLTADLNAAAATGVQRGSLYNAYGDKEAIFLRAFDFIDIGRVLEPSGTVPVTIKSLIFQM